LIRTLDSNIQFGKKENTGEHRMETLQRIRDIKVDYVSKQAKSKDPSDIMQHALLKSFNPTKLKNPKHIAQQVLGGTFDEHAEFNQLRKLQESVTKSLNSPEMKKKRNMIKNLASNLD